MVMVEGFQSSSRYSTEVERALQRITDCAGIRGKVQGEYRGLACDPWRAVQPLPAEGGRKDRNSALFRLFYADSRSLARGRSARRPFAASSAKATASG